MTRSGFSLIELVVVIGLSMIVASLLLVHAVWHRHTIVRHELDTLCYAIMMQAHRALAEGKAKAIVFMPPNSWSDETKVHTFAEHIHYGTQTGTTGPPGAPSHLVTNPLTYTGEKIICYPDGTVQAGTVYLLSDEDAAAYALTTDIGTDGLVRRYRMMKGKWSILP